MAESREVANAAATVTTSLAHSLLRASIHSARTAQLFQQVIGCLARKQLDPETVHGTLTRALETHNTALGAKTAELHARFFADLAGSSWLPVDNAEPPPFEPTDPIGWFRKLGTYAAERNARAVLPDPAVMATFLNGGTTARLLQLAQRWFRQLDELGELRAQFMEEVLQAVLAEVRPIGFDADVLELVAPLGQTSVSALCLENERGERISIRCAAGDIRRADGVGPAFRSGIDVSPAELILDAGAHGVIRVSLRLDAATYAADVAYIGALHILRDGQAHDKVPLRIHARPGERQ